MRHKNINNTKMLNGVVEPNQREYKKHEFCKSMNCLCFNNGACALKPQCVYSARQLHHWLMDNGFKIIKENENG